MEVQVQTCAAVAYFASSERSTKVHAVPRCPSARWMGPPYGTYLSYAMMHWMSTSPVFAYAERSQPLATVAVMILRRLSLQLNVKNRSDVNATENKSQPPTSFWVLAHPALLGQAQDGAYEMQKSQQKCVNAVRRLHTLQRQMIHWEQAVWCRALLLQLTQLLNAFLNMAVHNADTHLKFQPDNKNLGNAFQEVRAAAAQTIRLCAFVLSAERGRRLCGFWTCL